MQVCGPCLSLAVWLCVTASPLLTLRLDVGVGVMEMMGI